MLQRHGHEVRVVTTFSYYPHGRLQPKDRWRLWRWDVIPVLRVWSLSASNRGTWLRGLSFASYAAAATLAGLLMAKPGIVVASVPNPLTEAAAVVISWFRGARLVIVINRDSAYYYVDRGAVEY